MTPHKEKAILEFGKAQLHLEDLKTQLAQAKDEANSASMKLRVIADCFDQEDTTLNAVKILHVFDGDDQFVATIDKYNAKEATWNGPQNSNAPVVSIPKNLSEMMKRILSLEEELRIAEKTLIEKRKTVKRVI